MRIVRKVIQQNQWAELTEKPRQLKERQLMQMLPEIEAALAAGLRHEDIREHLLSIGLEFSSGHYYNAIHRARKKAKREPHSQKASKPADAKAASSPTTPSTQPGPAEQIGAAGPSDAALSNPVQRSDALDEAAPRAGPIMPPPRAHRFNWADYRDADHKF